MRQTKVREVVKESSSMGRFFLVLIFRLLLLAVGGTLAAMAGIAYATINPATSPDKPLIAKILPLPGEIKNLLPPSNPITLGDSANSQPEVVAPPTTAKLTPQQKKKIQADLNQLQNQLKNVRDRTSALEKQLGSNNSNQALETRLQVLNQQLKANPQKQPPKDSAATSQANQLAAANASLISQDTLTAILPGDALFHDNQAILLPEARPILDKLIGELQKYPNATIRIAAHSDGAGEAKDNRVLSFRQAEAISQYLASGLGNKYRWLLIGYGETRPIAPNDGKLNMQRNRRLEISIENQ